MKSLLLLAAATVALGITPSVLWAQGMGASLPATTGVKTRDVVVRGLGDAAPGHVPDLEDLAPHVREIQRRGIIFRDPKGLPVTASDWMNLSMRWMKAEDYTRAADGFRRSAVLFRGRGDDASAQVMETYAARCETQLGIFYQTPADPAALRRKYSTGQRLEPIYGTYVGAFIDHEDGVSQTLNDTDQNTGRMHRDVAEFTQRIGKRHAAYFTYCGYASGLPDQWFDNLKTNGAAAQWAIEPNNLDEVRDDDTLRGLARAAAEIGIPVFIRFASEMNGNWTPYHFPPAVYREKFRLVARVFHEIAPNAAMVWCPNEVPQSSMEDYYPGDDAVDWVGVNFYSCYYNDGNPSRPVWWANPADKLDYIYRTYSARHPIMICEWGATHKERADGVVRADFAVDKIGQLYASLPRRYPRIKAVFWLSMDAIQYASDERRRRNDYALLEEPKIAAQYRRMLSAPYFLESVRPGAVAPEVTAALTDNTVLSGRTTLSAYVKTYEQRPTVIWTVNGSEVQRFTVPGAYDWALDTRTLPNGPAKIAVSVIDSRGRVAARRVAAVMIRNSVASAAPRPAPAQPAVAEVTLDKAVRAAHTDAGALTLTVAPASGQVLLNARGANGGIRITAAAGDNAGESERALVLLLLRGDPASDPVVSLLNAGGGSAAIAALRAGDTASVPQNPSRVLRPDAVGRYTVRALLLPSRAAAEALIRPLADSPHYSAAESAWRSERLSSGASGPVYIADRTIDVIAP